MPELPEVETIKLGLQKRLPGLTLKKVVVLELKSLIGLPKSVEGKKVLSIQRRAKMLVVNLTGNKTLVFHLKMSGQVIYIKIQSRFIGGHPSRDIAVRMPVKSTRVIFEFNDGSKLYFNDQRKFGWVRIVDSSLLTDHSLFQYLGPEPLETGFTVEIFTYGLLKRKKTPVKVAILDQTVIAGVGNIYASEALYEAQINPNRKVSDLTDVEIKALYKGIIQSLRLGIKHGGSTRSHYLNAEGGRGYFLDYANVYGKDGTACKRCNGTIIKTKLAGRGTYFCPTCQH